MLKRIPTIQILIICFIGLAMSFAVAGQINKRTGRDAKASSLLAEAANIDQCGNGPQDLQVPCAGDAWQNGNLNQNQAHYLEGESVPYRAVITGIIPTPGTSYTIRLEWDTTDSGKHALDYLTTFDRTEPDADPCSDVPGCNPVIDPTVYPIPPDPKVAAGNDQIAGNDDDIDQIAGNFTLWGGTITNVSPYALTGSYDGTGRTSILITFEANSPTLVLAWGGHISTRLDWGVDHSAIAISGASYHMRLLELNGASTGQQDRSLANSAAVFPAAITIIKDAEPEVIFPFDFTVTGQFAETFRLWDVGYPDPVYPNQISYGNLAYFGTTNQVVVTESAFPTVFTIADILCTSDPNGGIGTNNNVVDLENLKVNIVLEEGEYVTCTFVNAITRPTAADVTVTGRIADKAGIAVPNAIIYLEDVNTSERHLARTNGFGYYVFDGITAGRAYVLTPTAKAFTFAPTAIAIDISDNIEGLDFIAIRVP